MLFNSNPETEDEVKPLQIREGKRVVTEKVLVSDSEESPGEESEEDISSPDKDSNTALNNPESYNISLGDLSH